jgi:uncharacterized protein
VKDEIFLKNKVLIVKTTNNCNIRCPYCYHFKNTNESKSEIISKDVIYNMTKSLLNNNEQRASFIWHGGEPLTIGIDYFKYAIEVQKELNEKKIRISNSIQTNGILLNEEYINFFEENDFHIGISIDGPKEIHMKNRGISEKTYDTIIENVKNLNKHKKIKYGVLTVVGKNTVNMAKDILDFYIENGIKHIAFLPCLFADDKANINYDLSITDTEYAKFLIDFFEAWLNSGVGNMEIRNFSEVFRYKKGIKRSLCINCSHCQDFFTVAPDGQLYLCDNLNQCEENRVGTVWDDFEDIVNREKLVKFQKSIENKPDECKSCAYFDFCNSGCAYHRWVNGNGSFNAKQLFCKTTKIVTAHIEKVLESANLT